MTKIYILILSFIFNASIVFSQNYYQNIYSFETGLNTDIKWFRNNSIKSITEYIKEKDTLLLTKRINVNKKGEITNIKEWDIHGKIYNELKIFYNNSQQISKITIVENNNSKKIKDFEYDNSKLIEKKTTYFKNNKVSNQKISLYEYNNQDLIRKKSSYSTIDTSIILYKYNNDKLITEKTFLYYSYNYYWPRDTVYFELNKYNCNIISKDKLLKLKDTVIYTDSIKYFFKLDKSSKKIIQTKEYFNKKRWEKRLVTEKYKYDEKGNLLIKTIISEDTIFKIYNKYKYDDKGRLINISSANEIINYKYKGNKKIVKSLDITESVIYKNVFKNELIIHSKKYKTEKIGQSISLKFNTKYRYYKNNNFKSIKNYNAFGIVTYSIKYKYNKNKLLNKIIKYELENLFYDGKVYDKWIYKYSYY